jgi:hypothetical protein
MAILIDDDDMIQMLLSDEADSTIQITSENIIQADLMFSHEMVTRTLHELRQSAENDFIAFVSKLDAATAELERLEHEMPALNMSHEGLQSESGTNHLTKSCILMDKILNDIRDLEAELKRRSASIEAADPPLSNPSQMSCADGQVEYHVTTIDIIQDRLKLLRIIKSLEVSRTKSLILLHESDQISFAGLVGGLHRLRQPRSPRSAAPLASQRARPPNPDRHGGAL